MKKKKKKLTLVTLGNITFSMDAYKNLNKNELISLKDTALDFFDFVQSFRSKLKIRGFVNLWLLEEQIQDLETVTSGIFQIYFYDNLLNLNLSSKIQNQKANKNNCSNFTKRTICFKRPKQKRRSNRTIRARAELNSNMT